VRVVNHAQHWCIVGAGVMGLTLAKRLAQAGQQVTLCEAAPEVGGLASAWNLSDFIWDRHYHVTLLSDQLTREMLAELGLEGDMRWVETKTGFLSNGRLYSMSNSWEFLKFPPLNLWEKLRLGLTIFVASRIRDSSKLEGILVSDWLTRWSGQGTFRKIWQPLLQAKLGATYQRVSAAFIWATIARMYRARQTGLKKEMFGYLPGGYARVLDAYARALSRVGVRIVCSTGVERVSPKLDGSVHVDLTDGTSAVFDKVVLTVSSAAVAKLCSEMLPTERTQHAEIEYLGIICASVLLTKPLSPYYVTNITDGGTPFTAVIEMTALADPAEFGGRHLIYLPRYASADDPVWQQSDEQIRELFLASLCRMYPQFSADDVMAFRVSRMRQVMALPTLNYSERIPPIKTSLQNVFVVNSAQIVKGTLNVNEVIDVAETAIRKTLLPSVYSDDQTTVMAEHV
jgi:protoporphyrinogen oxidase